MPVSKGRKRKKKKSPSKQLSKSYPMAHSMEMSRTQRQQGMGPLSQQSQSYYQGIVPSPEMMEHYKDVDETLPGRLVALTEDEAAHRRGLEQRLTTHAFVTTLIGQIFAFLAVGLIAVLSYLYMINGHAEEGKVIAVAIIVSLAALFLGKQVFRKSKNDEKSK